MTIFDTEYLQRIKEDNLLLSEEIVLIDNIRMNVQKAVTDGFLAIHAVGRFGFGLAAVSLPSPRFFGNSQFYDQHLVSKGSFLLS